MEGGYRGGSQTLSSPEPGWNCRLLWTLGECAGLGHGVSPEQRTGSTFQGEDQSRGKDNGCGRLIPPDVWSNFKAMAAFVQAQLERECHMG